MMKDPCTCSTTGKPGATHGQLLQPCAACLAAEEMAVRVHKYGLTLQARVAAPAASFILKAAQERLRTQSMPRIRRSILCCQLASVVVSLLVLWRLCVLSMHSSLANVSDQMVSGSTVLVTLFLTFLAAVAFGAFLLHAASRWPAWKLLMGD